TWLVTAEILLAIACAALAIWLLNKSAALISKTQRKLYQSKLSYNSKNKLGKILKPFKPNAAWLFALLLAEIANPYFEDRTLFKNFFFEPLFLYVIYKLILLSSNYSIESAYTSTNKFISKSVLDTIHKQAQYFSLYTTLFFIPL